MPVAVRTPKPALRDAILGAAEALGSELGLPGVTMRQIAARVDVSTAMIYEVFAGKASLLREMKRHIDAELEQELVDAVVDVDDPLEVLYALCLAYVRFARRSQWRYALAFQEAVVDFARPSSARTDPFVVKAAACFERLGTCPDIVAPSTAAIQLWVALHGLASAMLDAEHRPRTEHPSDAELAFVDSYVNAFLRGLVATRLRG
jgi:AcrR family transcriptional regulator